MLGIYEMATRGLPWDTAGMARADKKERAAQSALRIADKLNGVDHGHPSVRQWLMAAGVSNSFLTNMRGTPTKGPADPSVDQLRQVLKMANLSLPEFFLEEGRGRVIQAPTKQALEEALADAMPQLPRRVEDRPSYLAQVVLDALALPADRPATHGSAEPKAEDDRATDALPAVATKRS